MTTVTDTGCNFKLEDGGLFGLEDGTSGILGEACFTNAVPLADLIGRIPAYYNMIVGRPGQYTNFSDVTPYNTALSAYGLVRATIGAPSETSPSDTPTGQRFVETATTGTHEILAGDAIQRAVNLRTVNYIRYRVACIAKPAERTRLILKLTAYNFSTVPVGTVSACFDLAGLATGFDESADTGWSIAASSVTDVGAGYVLCTLDVQADLPNSGGAPPSLLRPGICLDNGSGTAARSASYAGDGTSGLVLWYFSLLPAAAWRIDDTPAFLDHFLTDTQIDRSDTRNSGYSWYTHNSWPNNSVANNSIYTEWFNNGGVTPSGYIDVANSILTLNNDNSGYGSGLMTVGYSASAPGYVGTGAWKLPFMAESKMSYDNSIQGGMLYPSFWSASLEELTGELVLNEKYVEIDFMEGPGPGGSPPDLGLVPPVLTLHRWEVINDPVNSAGHITQGNFVAVPLDANTSLFNLYSGLYVNQANNDGTFGFGLIFFNYLFAQQTDQHWSDSSSWIDGFATTQPAGAWSELNTHTFPLVIGAAGSNFGGTVPVPTSFDYVAIYTGSTTTVTDTGCNFLLEDGGLLAQEDGTSGLLGENCFSTGTSVSDTNCDLLLEDGGHLAQEDGSSAILLERCEEPQTGVGWPGKPRRPAKRWWELIREEREAIRNAERLANLPLQEAIDDVVEIIEEQQGVSGRRLLDLTNALKDAAAARTAVQVAQATRQLHDLTIAIRAHRAAALEQDDETILLLMA